MHVIVDHTGSFLSLNTGIAETHRFHAIWLRDNAQDKNTRSVQNGQRLISLQDIPDSISIETASVTGNLLSIHFQPESISIDFEIAWLLKNSYDHNVAKPVGWVNSATELWDGADLNAIPTVEYNSLIEDKQSRRLWLHDIKRFGFGLVNNGPLEPDSLLTIIEQFGYVRETNYGDVFDVRTEVKPSNLAYTGLALQAHTDNPYRDPVPTLQLLYCLQNSTDGGDSMVVDGFNVATRLQQENSQWFDVLASYCARFEYSGSEGVYLTSRRPMIEIGPDGELIGVRFNNRSCAPITDVPFDKMQNYYAAYRRFGELIEAQTAAVSFKLAPGDCFLLDNTRVLHARKGFSGSGDRWLRGCYADKDGLNSTLAALQAEAL